MREYYDRRAPEYDETAYGAANDEESRELDRLQAAAGTLPAARTVDVGCGTGYFTRHLRGEVVGVDRSEAMLRIARGRLPQMPLIRGEATALPFRDSSFDRLFTSFFYGHLEESPRQRFLTEARRVAPELVVVEERLRDGLSPAGWEERRLTDGSPHLVYKRYFRPEELTDELGGDLAFHDERFLMVVA